MIQLNQADSSEYIDIYKRRYARFGYSPITLGWNTGKQDIRFDLLRNGKNLEGKSILDVGCGFGDLNRYLQLQYHSYSYMGIDLVPDLIMKAEELFPSSESYRICFLTGDFLGYTFDTEFDYIFISGVFGKRLKNDDNYEYVDAIIKKATELAHLGVGIDFSTTVGQKLRKSYGFLYNPADVVQIISRYANNFTLNHAYFPTEFSVLINKDSSYDPNNIFNSFKRTKEMK